MSQQKPFHNFIVIGVGQDGKPQKQFLVFIGDSLYSQASYGVAHFSPLLKRFLAINKPLANSQGQVHTGQILYLPTKFGNANVSDAEITQELLKLNHMVNKLDDKGKAIHGGHHQLLSTMVASTGIGLDVGLDLRGSYLKLANENIKDSLNRIARYSQRATKIGTPNAFQWGQKRIQNELDELADANQYYLDNATLSDKLTRDRFLEETGVPWNDMVYDIKRIGMDQSSLGQMSRHLQATIRIASKVRTVGRIAIAVSMGEAIYETGEVCQKNAWGEECVSEAVQQSGGVLGAYFGAKIAERGLETTDVGEATCNLLLDEETAGLGYFACKVIVPVMFTVPMSVGGNLLGKASGAYVVQKSDRIIHTHSVRVRRNVIQH